MDLESLGSLRMSFYTPRLFRRLPTMRELLRRLLMLPIISLLATYSY